MAVQAKALPRGPDFPASDGDAMPERSSHQQQLFRGIFVIDHWLAPIKHYYVGGNQFLYFNPANQADNVAPDIFVVLGIEHRDREKYQTWDEDDRIPDLIIEILSPKTRKDDLGAKKDLYARLGVREYYVHDPRPGVRRRLFEGWYLHEGVYVPFPRLLSGGILSVVLGAELRVVGQWLRLIDPASRQPVPEPDELEEARQAAEARAAHEATARQAAQQQARQEAAARQAAQQQAQQEAAARQASEEARLAAEARAGQLAAEQERLRAEIARLRAELAGGEQ